MQTTSVLDLLAASGKSMSRVAREAGISISSVSRIASGERIPSLPMVFKLATVLNVHPTILLEAFASQGQDGLNKAA